MYATPPDTARLSGLSVGDPESEARQAEEERRTRLISEVLGVKKELTDRRYLHGRGITDATLDSPAFQGRIFTAQQNEHYKSLLPLPKNGIWVSHPTDDKDTRVPWQRPASGARRLRTGPTQVRWKDCRNASGERAVLVLKNRLKDCGCSKPRA
ncbi:hypothetical protein [Hymenobacter metallicola]|uniref:Uncharacterized protein n=1 Tax=Hymenobacter metallicola TaxID=2563114 RepID=A0A4Z0PTB1_9BACT|nr:hypothetical protein [Hymenobacter metallicola]TGE21000.1 hypothetical protein E5K02_24870 [Hymenobacter metallicola]